jgi:integrase/recombinase XerD
MTRLRQRMLDDLRRRNYSPDTIRGYVRAVQQFAEYFGRSPEQMGAEELRRYQIHLLHERKLALGTVENNISALRFLYRKTLKRHDLAFDDLPFPKQPRTLPTVLSQDEVTRLIEAAPNRMHRMLLMLLYATGMRRTETSLLKVSDIDSQRMVIHIQRGKGPARSRCSSDPQAAGSSARLLAMDEAPRLSIPQQEECSRCRAAYLRQDGVERLPGGRYPCRDS